MSDLRIRLYNVLFGDAILVTVPGASRKQHMLIDVGNVLSGKGGGDDVFGPVLEDIEAQTRGVVDLYVMTHEHMDHVQGLLHASSRFGKKVRAKNVWITASADPDYYKTHSDARRKKLALFEAYDRAEKIVAARGARYAAFAAMMANNNPRSTKDCVDYIRDEVVTPDGEVRYLSRDDSKDLKSPIKGVKFEILAPEEDTADYYGRGKPFTAGAVGEASADAPASASLTPPPGVDVGAFADLVAAREEGFLSSLLQIDRAANNTSLVLRMTWGGRVLLFPGDAEEKSWALMAARAGLGEVDFLKLGHHGSHNGMPVEYLETLLPSRARKRHVGLSTCLGCYNNVPHTSLLRKLRALATVHDTRNVAPGDFVDIRLSDLT